MNLKTTNLEIEWHESNQMQHLENALRELESTKTTDLIKQWALVSGNATMLIEKLLNNIPEREAFTICNEFVYQKDVLLDVRS